MMQGRYAQAHRPIIWAALVTASLLSQAAFGFRFKTAAVLDAALDAQLEGLQSKTTAAALDDAQLERQKEEGTLNISGIEASANAARTATAKANAQFLIEATFGPTRASLKELEATSMEAWISKQIALPASSHRAYYRERVNPRWVEQKYSTVAPALGSCDIGARWSDVTFQDIDKLKPIKVKGNKIFVDGELRTQVDPKFVGNELPVAGQCTNEMNSRNNADTCEKHKLRHWECGHRDWIKNKRCSQKCWDAGKPQPGMDCSKSGWVNYDFEGVLCEMSKKIGGAVILGKTAADCEEGGAKEIRLNPAVWFSTLKAGGATDGSNVGGLAISPFKTGTVLLSKSSEKCGLGKVLFFHGKYYLQESRIRLLENSIGSPAATSNYEVCPTVPRNLFNKKECKVSSACTRMDNIDVEVTIDVALRKSFLKHGGNYVYMVKGLKHTEEPCKVSSRWQLCKSCQESKLPESDIEMISEALAGKSGDIRDISVNCASVPAGAVVRVGNQPFENVHPQTGNVYDFSGWVDEHPGGPEKIKQWAKGRFELTFPKHHPMERWNAQTTQNTLHLLGVEGSTLNFQDLPSHLQSPVLKHLQESGDAGISKATGYLTCGSPNEVASDPAKGHNMQMFQFWDWKLGRFVDTNFDNMVTNGNGDLHKQAIWFTLAMQAEDQLRQRMAWALSQIIVASNNDYSAQQLTEKSLVFYDIFVRNAFGSYRNILREVTYSPFMATWLTYMRSTSYDYNRFYADENYAREVMQLFSIGVWKLNMDGTVQKDENGEDIPSYDNDDIMSLARVFTGFDRRPSRANYEAPGNDIDPLRILPKMHDVYPKTDLNKNYIGDGYPLCSELPDDVFLRKGASYEFVGYDYSGLDAVALPENSELFSVLCGASEGKPCDFKGWVELPEDLVCKEKECDGKLSVVSVKSGHYRFVPPACVYNFFFQGQLRARMDKRFPHSRACTNPALPLAGASCCAGCRNIAPTLSVTDCEEFYDQTGRKRDKVCGNATAIQTCEEARESLGELFIKHKCKTSQHWAKGRICELSCFEAGVGYDGNPHDCSLGVYKEKQACHYETESVSFYDAEKACSKEGMKVCAGKTEDTCKWSEKSDFVWLPTPCTVEIQIDADGKVRSQQSDKSKNNPVIVQWQDDNFPVAGECPTEKGCREVDDVDACICEPAFKTEAVFQEIPTSEKLLAELKIGAVAPKTSHHPFQTKNGIKAYSYSKSFNEKTIFEFEGKFFANVRSQVVVGGFTFRNPPVFNVPELPSAKAVEDEVDALIDHLFYHPNVAPFLAYRLIQRFTSSNPTPAYVKSVAEAFTTGSYGGKTYSGTYGDLGALAAAMLLHPEVRKPEKTESNGAFREPLLKIVHFMRAMEYKDSKNRELMLNNLIGSQGQFPYSSPTVFNFYKPDYKPARFDEEHPTLVSPEFEIFTTTEAVNFVNAMQKTIAVGSQTGCGGFGLSNNPCEQGTFALNEPPATIEELDLVLTGGRLEASRSTVQQAYDNAKEGEKLKAAELALALSPEFHTLGQPQPLKKRVETKEATTLKGEGYKAVVLLYFAGGADTWNMLVPLNANCKLYDEYREARTNVALKPEDLLEIKTKGQACSKFGIHKSMPFYKELYDMGEAAFVSNVGNLAEPLTKADMQDATKTRCKGLFGHADQTTGAMTLQCQTLGSSPKGSGGRMGDALGEQGFATTSFSVAGAVPWTGGFRTATEMINSQKGSTRFNNLETLEEIIVNITSTQHKNAYCEEYAQQMANSLKSSKKLASIFDAAQLATEAMDASKSGLGAQLKQVSKLIATRKERSAERDFFYVSVGGWDMHSGLINGMEQKLKHVDDALKLFVEELKAQGTWKDVVLTTMSDFGRTLMSNGAGSDHAWAGNHLVMGGSIKGGVVYNDFPESMLIGSDVDLGRGRLIPKYPYESVFVPIAKWMGVEEGQMAKVFPNMHNFNGTKHFINHLF